MCLLNVVMATKCHYMQYSNVTLLAEEIDSNINFTCILEGNSTESAVTWNTPFDNYTDLKGSRYLPDSKLLCNYIDGRSNKECSPQGWTVNQTAEFPFNPITDYRWESFPTISLKSEHKQLAEFSKNTFSISLSFRIKTKASLYLCSNQRKWQELHSECFVVLITKTNISMYSYLDKDHLTYLNSTTINELKEDEWANIFIRHTYRNNIKRLILKIANNRISFKTEDNPLIIKHLSVKSKEFSLWKVHNYWFLSTTKSMQHAQIGKKMPVSSKTFCISLYVALCSTCSMSIALEPSKHATEETTYSKKVEFPNIDQEKTDNSYSWKEIQVILEVSNNAVRYYDLYLALSNTNSSTDGFWAVDNLRLCHANEVRISNLLIKKNIAKQIQCQPLLENPVSVADSNLITSCPEESKIGTHCDITCESIFGINGKNCERHMICTRQDTNTDCYCARGYQGSFCKDECQNETWGSGCKNKCGHCKNKNCNSMNGSCKEGCEDGFALPNCTSSATVKNIRVTTTLNSITVEWNSPASSSTPTFSYIVTYRHKKYTACTNDLEDTAYTHTVTTDNRKVVANNLLPYSDYYFTIAAILNKVQGNISIVTASTSCTDIPGQEEVLLNVAVSQSKPSTYPLILLTEPRCSNIKGPLTYEANFICFDDWCTKEFTPLNINYTNNLDVVKVFQQPVSILTPYSNYIVTITSRRFHGNVNTENMLTAEFKTREAKPLSVNSLTVHSRNESTISLRWQAPYPPHGQLEHYKVGCIGLNACKSVVVQPTQCELWDNFTCADLTHLSKSTKYIVEVQAKNYGVPDYGKNYYIKDILTEESESEPVLNVKNTWEMDTAILHWDHPLITNGPLVYFKIEINVIHSEHFKHTGFNSNFTVAKYSRTYDKMLDLKYSAVYNVTVYPINKFKGKPSKTITIKMPPPTPKLLYTPSIINCIDLKCELKIAKPVNMSKCSYLYVIVDRNAIAQDKENLNVKQLLINSTKNDKSKTEWLAVALPVTNITDDFIYVTLGDDTNTTSMYGKVVNKPLHSDTNYLVTVIIANHFLNKTRFSLIHNLHSDFKERKYSATNSTLYALFLLLLIPIGIYLWIFYNRRNKSKTDGKAHVNKSLLPTCFRRSSTLSEHLPLHTAERYKQSQGISKPVGIVKPKSLYAVDAESPLISQYSENMQYTNKVKLEDFEEYVKKSIGTTEEDGELVRQHNLFVRGQTHPWEYGLRKENKFKNRYNNLIAYDHSRVKLEKINKDEFSDYINANFINGYKKPKSYIATQGPKPTTICDFWRMIWQEGSTTIVMVANVEEDGKRKTEEYWPKLNSTLEIGSIEICLEKTEFFSNYVFRTLRVTKDNEERIIEQLHFTSWPDHGVPLYPQTLVPFVKKVSTVPQDVAPIVVHCSAGVGRTGTIILCDYVLRMAEDEGAVDFLATLQELREQRANLVDSPNQYKLAHLVVLETLFGLDTTIPCNYELEPKINALITSDDLYEQMEYIEKINWQDQTICLSYTSIPNAANKHKNRFSSIVPDGYGRVYISRYPVTDEHSDYINAVEVDGFDVPKRFIVTQQPLPTTVNDFWRMVSEKEVTTIVSLNDVEPCDQSSSIFWPEEDEILDLEFAAVNYLEKDEFVTHDYIKLTLVHKTDEQTEQYGKNISIVKMKGWPPLKTIPENLDSLMETWGEVDKISRGNNPIVVTCYDGAKACGVFVALSFVIEKIKLEQVCDVSLAVRTVRRSRKEFVTNVEQFQLLYKAAVQYLKGFETYSNFPITNK